MVVKKRIFILAVLVCMLTAGCKSKVQRFGIDIDRLNPLVMTAVDNATGKSVFSRDHSIISSVTMLFEKMNTTPVSEKLSEKGINFTVSTMFGNVTYGECWGNRLRLDGEEYLLEKDYSKDIRLLFERIESETENTADVTRDKILAVKPEMTYRELLDSFGKTLETAVVGEDRAFLYKYRGRPFYIRYKKDQDKVNMTGSQLLENIWENYNLDQSLTKPEPLGGGRLSVYLQAFDKLVDQFEKESLQPPAQLIIDTNKLVYLTDEERYDLIRYFEDKYSLKVVDSRLAEMMAEGDFINQTDQDKLILWIKQYSYIGTNRISFDASGMHSGSQIITLNMNFKLEKQQWIG